MVAYGMESVPRTTKLKRRHISQFGEELDFWHPKRYIESELVFSASIPSGALLEVCVKAAGGIYRDDEGGSSDEEEIEDDALDEDDTQDLDAAVVLTLFQAATILRNELLAVERMLKWPSPPSDLKEENIPGSDLLYNFLAWVLAGKLT